MSDRNASFSSLGKMVILPGDPVADSLRGARPRFVHRRWKSSRRRKTSNLAAPAEMGGWWRPVLPPCCGAGPRRFWARLKISCRRAREAPGVPARRGPSARCRSTGSGGPREPKVPRSSRAPSAGGMGANQQSPNQSWAPKSAPFF